MRRVLCPHNTNMPNNKQQLLMSIRPFFIHGVVGGQHPTV